MSLIQKSLPSAGIIVFFGEHVSLGKKKAQQSRERIFLEGMKLFARDGYDRTTMEAIAEAAEVSPSTLYRYFPTKESIILRPAAAIFENLAAAFAGSAAEPPSR
jgi:AcrR family transcriptional regulator